MATQDEKLKRDKNLCRNAKIKALARVIGYNETGEPVEIVYTLSTNCYSIQVAGEEISDAAIETIEQFIS